MRGRDETTSMCLKRSPQVAASFSVNGQPRNEHSTGLRRSEIAAPPAGWRHFRFWGLIIAAILALAVLAAVYY
jgi:hypothetical protein